jgi:hypothetical protein
MDGGGDAQGDSAARDDAQHEAGALSFAADVYPIITARCIACHNPNSPSFPMHRLDMTTGNASGAYSQLVMVRAMGNVAGGAALTCMVSGLIRVVPNNSAQSLLYNKVDSKLMGAPALCGNPMPNPTAAPSLAAGDVTTIEQWIDQGANP